jgi:NAD(P)-dependent dehydrogenase (short-subunit alcohol dehydrogenase family)
VRDEAAVAGFMDTVEGRHGGLDALVNLAYCPHSKGIDELTGEEFGRALVENVGKAFLLAREAKRLMKPGASVVLFSSMYGGVSPDPRIYHPPMRPNAIEYGVSKAGIEQMVRYLAVSWAKDGIRVNAVSPGPFPHPSLQREQPEFMERLAAKTPLGRIGRQDEVTGAVVFLVSDEASYVDGHVLMVDGGWTIW